MFEINSKTQNGKERIVDEISTESYKTSCRNATDTRSGIGSENDIDSEKLMKATKRRFVDFFEDFVIIFVTTRNPKKNLKQYWKSQRRLSTSVCLLIKREASQKFRRLQSFPNFFLKNIGHLLSIPCLLEQSSVHRKLPHCIFSLKKDPLVECMISTAWSVMTESWKQLSKADQLFLMTPAQTMRKIW